LLGAFVEATVGLTECLTQRNWHMSAYTTILITKSKAIELYLGKVIDRISVEDLERFLDRELEHRLYNVIVVPDGYEDNDNHIL
jgi:hypothetical protein